MGVLELDPVWTCGPVLALNHGSVLAQEFVLKSWNEPPKLISMASTETTEACSGKQAYQRAFNINSSKYRLNRTTVYGDCFFKDMMHNVGRSSQGIRQELVHFSNLPGHAQVNCSITDFDN